MTMREASGASTARTVAAQHADSVDLEEHYDQRVYQYDTVRVLLDGGEDPRAQRFSAEIASERLHRTPLFNNWPHAKLRLMHDSSSIYHTLRRSPMVTLEKSVKSSRGYGMRLPLRAREKSGKCHRRQLPVQELRPRKEELNQPGGLRAIVQEREA